MRAFIGAIDRLNAILLGLLFCLWLSFMVAQSDSRYFASLASKNFEHAMDLRFYYAFGQIARGNDHPRLYDRQTQNQYARLLNPGNQSQFLDYVPYPPFFVFLAVPLSYLPLPVAYLALCWGSLALACLGLRKLTIAVRGIDGKVLALVVMGALVSWPSRHCFIAGQIGWLLVAMVSFYLFAFLSGRRLTAGVFLALLFVKPQLGLMLSASSLAWRRWSVLVACLATLVILFAGAFACLGYETIESFFLTLRTISGASAMDSSFRPQGMVCLRALFLLFLSPPVAMQVSLVGSLVAFLLLVGVWAAASPGNQASCRWACAVTILAYVVASPHVHVYDSVLLIVACACTLNHVSIEQSLCCHPQAKVIWQLLFIVYPLASCLAYVCLPYGHSGLSFNLVYLAANLILLLCALSLFRLSLGTGGAYGLQGRQQG